jgi:hypothetical protein
MIGLEDECSDGLEESRASLEFVYCSKLRASFLMCYWKQWRHPRTKVRKLMELGVPKDFAVITGSSSKAYWHLSKCYATNAGMSNDWLEKQGLVNIKELWCILRQAQ